MHIKKRSCDGRKILGTLYSISWSGNLMTNKNKAMIYRTVVDSMLYGAETWTINLQQQKRSGEGIHSRENVGT